MALTLNYVIGRICALWHMHVMDIDLYSAILSALAHPARRQALALLRRGNELCVCELMSSLGVGQSRMSRHMSALKDVGLVTDRRDAQWVRYRLANKIDPAVMRIIDAVLAVTPPPAAPKPFKAKTARPKSRSSRNHAGAAA